MTLNSSQTTRMVAGLCLSLTAACTGPKPTETGWAPETPVVVWTDPVDDAVAVAINASVSAGFSEEMDSATLGYGSLTLTSGDPAVLTSGTVIYAGGAVTFWPAEHLASNTAFTATVGASAESAGGVALGEDHTWTFTTGDSLEPGAGVDLGAAEDFVILAKTGISTVPGSVFVGDLGISPAAASFITGFSLTADASNSYSTSSQVTGRVYAADYAPPTPTTMTAAVGDMERAFTDAAGRAPDATEIGAGNIGGMNMAAGVYKWGTGLLIPTDVTLSGSATDVWIFEIGQDLTMSSGASVVLAGGARAANVYWQVAGLVDLGTTAHCEGTILSQTAVTLRTGATVNGRLLAQAAVDVDGSTVVAPTP